METVIEQLQRHNIDYDFYSTNCFGKEYLVYFIITTKINKNDLKSKLWEDFKSEMLYLIEYDRGIIKLEIKF